MAIARSSTFTQGVTRVLPVTLRVAIALRFPMPAPGAAVTLISNPRGGATNVHPVPESVHVNCGTSGVAVPAPVNGSARNGSTAPGLKVADGVSGSRRTAARHG